MRTAYLAQNVVIGRRSKFQISGGRQLDGG